MGIYLWEIVEKVVPFNVPGLQDPQRELLEGTNLGHFGANFPSVFAPKTGPNGPKSCAVTQYMTLVYSG